MRALKIYDVQINFELIFKTPFLLKIRISSLVLFIRHWLRSFPLLLPLFSLSLTRNEKKCNIKLISTFWILSFGKEDILSQRNIIRSIRISLLAEIIILYWDGVILELRKGLRIWVACKGWGLKDFPCICWSFTKYIILYLFAWFRDIAPLCDILCILFRSSAHAWSHWHLDIWNW